MTALQESQEEATYRRDTLTLATFSGLLAFGILNALLGPALPYVRAVEHISYAAGALHQAAFAIGGGLAGLLALRAEARLGRGKTIRLGLAAAAIAGFGMGYGNRAAITVLAAFLMGLLATSALVRMWAALADAHGPRRTVAMTEGEVSVSFGGMVGPLLVGGFAATVLTWRFAFVVGALIVAVAVLAMGAVRIPPPAPNPAPPAGATETLGSGRFRPGPTLVIVFGIVALEFALSFWLASYLNDSVGLGRDLAVLMVSGLYAANLAGRLLTSRFARRASGERLLAGALLVCLLGLPFLLTAHNAIVAAIGIALTGVGIGALFPLTSSLHVGVSSRNADGAIGQVLLMAAAGQIIGPLVVGAIAQTEGLRAALLLLPALVLTAGAGLAQYHRQISLRSVS